jgi:acyl-CoA synthetase (AMP-forming)/AMP-acid ligase II
MHPFRYVASTPDKPAIIMGQSGETVSFAELDANVNRLAHLLRANGLRRGDCIAYMIENRPLVIELAFAAARTGMFFVPVSTRLKSDELYYIVTNSQAKAFFTTAALAAVAQATRPQLPPELRCFIAGATLDGYQNLEDEVARQPASPIADPTEGSAFFYSSGSTGRPKGVKRPLPEEPFDSVTAFDQRMQTAYGFEQNMVYLSPAPLYHAAPLTFSLAAIGFGGTLVVMEKFEPQDALALIARHRVTHSQWVPTMFARLVKLHPDIRQKYDLSSLKLAIHAAAPCPPEIKRQMIDWWGDAIVEYYSGTEGVGMCLVTAKEWLAHPGTVGRALGCNIHICDDDGNELPPGQIGLIYFGGGMSFDYHGDPEKTRAAKHRNGWATFGDVGYQDDEGYLYLTDRKDFMIISGGVNIYPAETESVLINHPAVMDVAVIGVPNEEFGEEVKAIVQPADWQGRGTALAEELIAYCRGRLADVKCPRTVDFVEELPRLPTGKLQKKLIRAPYWEGRQSQLA